MRSLALALLAMFLTQPVFASARSASRYESFTTDYPPVYSIAGFDFLSRLEIFKPFDGEGKTFSFRQPDGTYTVTWQQPTARILLGKPNGATLTILIAPIVDKIEKYLAEHPEVSRRALPQEALTWEQNEGGTRVKIYFDDISLRREGKKVTLYHFKADLLVKSSPTVVNR